MALVIQAVFRFFWRHFLWMPSGAIAQRTPGRWAALDLLPPYQHPATPHGADAGGRTQREGATSLEPPSIGVIDPIRRGLSWGRKATGDRERRDSLL